MGMGERPLWSASGTELQERSGNSSCNGRIVPVHPGGPGWWAWITADGRSDCGHGPCDYEHRMTLAAVLEGLGALPTSLGGLHGHR